SWLDTSLTASVVNLLAIAVERHRTVLTMQLHSEMSAQRVVGLIFSIWAAALLLGLIPSYGWHCLCSLESCSRMAPLYSRSYLTFWSLIGLVIVILPGLVIIGWVIVIIVEGLTGDTIMALVKTVTIILGAFVVCWTPGQVLLLLDGLGCASCDVLAVEKYVLLLAEVNSLINAVVYSWRDNEMRSTFRRLLCLPCPRHAKYAAPERGLSSHNGHFTVDSSI
ncbi:lysophosphatidic acid receptor 2, partial [Geospiza fortis]|uniref:Lysophosphatidic acid receptor 2 n=1 Tax=Geospiza fortis TaxID=48883 RepID=A0A6I9ZCI2_GEOFO